VCSSDLGHTMAIAKADVIRVEAIRSGQLVRQWRHPDPQGACLLDFQQKEATLAASDCSGHSVRLFDASTGKQVDAVPASPTDMARTHPSNEVGAIAFSPAEYLPSYHLALSTAQSVRVFHAGSWHGYPELSRWMQLSLRPWYCRDRQQWTDRLDSDWINHAAMSRTGDVIAVSERDLLRVIDTRTASIWQERGWTGEVAVSDDGALVASVSDSSRIRLWEVASRKPLRQLSGHWTQVTTLEFSPDGRYLASGSHDTRVKVFDTATGETLSTASIKPLRVIGVRFAQSARIVEIHDEEGNEWTWSWTTDLPPARSSAPRGHWMESGNVPEDPWLKDCTYLADCAPFRSLDGKLNQPRNLITARWVRDDLAAVVYSSGVVAFVRAPDRAATLEIKLLEDNPRVAIARSMHGTMEVLGEDPAAELQPACHVGAFTFPWIVCKDRFRAEHLVQRAVAGEDP
jgi:WD40 repeat protein